MPFAGNHIPARVCDQSVNVPKNMTAVCVKFSDDFHKGNQSAGADAPKRIYFRV